MKRNLACGLVLLSLCGCWSSDSRKPKAKLENETRGQTTRSESTQTSWPGHPNVPFVPLMNEVNGIPIPRLEVEEDELSDLQGDVPADVGNDAATGKSSEPTTGGRITLRVSSEPKTLNPITESSAVQTYITNYTIEGLIRQDPETFEFEPLIAKKWVAEDSVKLAADYPGKERQVALEGQEPADELRVEFPRGTDDNKLPKLNFETSNAAGPLPEAWVGMFPAEKIPGAPTTGYHFWSDDEGRLVVQGILPGKYTVKTGGEIFGKTEEADDGTLRVTPATDENPLHDLLPDGQDALLLQPEQWSDVQGQTVWTYYLRDDVKWQDGTPFTTKDLLFGYAVINNRFVDGDSLRVYYADLISAVAPDDHTIRMRFRQQYFKALEFTSGLSAYSPPWHFFERLFEEQGKKLTLERLSPGKEEETDQVSAHGQQFGVFFNKNKAYNDTPLGTGPYKITRWERNNLVELKRNPDYWNSEGGGYLDRIIFKLIPDDVSAMKELQAGNLDFLWGLQPEQYFEELKGPPDWIKKQYVKAKWYTPGFSYIGWNLRRPIFKDRRVRIALSLLFDKQKFLETKLYNAGKVISGSQYFFGMGYDHSVQPIGYDPDTAIDLLAEAGWVDTDGDGILDKDGKPFQFALRLPQGKQSTIARAEVIQKNLKDVGIVMEIEIMEWAAFIDQVKAKNFDAVNLGWAQPLESDPFQIWHSSEADPEDRGSNAISFADPLADELIERIRITLDKEERERLHWSMHRLLDREQPYMFLYVSKDLGVYDQRYRGVKWYAMRPGFDLTEWYVPKDLQRE